MNFTDFFLKYVDQKLFNKIVESNKITFATMSAYKQKYRGSIPRAYNLVVICKYIAQEYNMNENDLILEAMEVIRG